MASGGKRVRSGPKPDPNSRTSERRGYTLRNLPNSECRGRAPSFPLPVFQAKSYDPSSGQMEPDAQLTEAWAAREAELWKWLWRQPQARAWRMPQYRYMVYEVAQYCRQCVLCERAEAKAADRTVLIRLADRIGLSPAGLAALGWKISEDNVDGAAAHEVPASDAERAQSGADTKIVHFPRRLRA